MGKTQKHWFKRRRYGYGWTPVTWQGWLTIVGSLAVILGGAFTIKDTPDGEFTKELGIYLLVVLLSVSTLIRIAIAKGPKPKWRWGKKPSDNPDEDW